MFALCSANTVAISFKTPDLFLAMIQTALSPSSDPVLNQLLSIINNNQNFSCSGFQSRVDVTKDTIFLDPVKITAMDHGGA